jgi:hypothetical protein
VCFHDDDDGDDVRKRLQVRTRTLLWLQVETAAAYIHMSTTTHTPPTPPRESLFPPRRVTPHATFNGTRSSRHLAIDARQSSMNMRARSRWVCMYQHPPFKLTQWPRTSRATSLISRMHIAGPFVNRVYVPESQRTTSVYPHQRRYSKLSMFNCPVPTYSSPYPSVQREICAHTTTEGKEYPACQPL